MPDILTKPTKTLREAAQALIAAEACNYDRDAMCSEGLFDRLREALRENGLPTSKNAVERDSAQSSPIPAGSATPETIHISLPALRAVVLGVIDERRWRFYSHLWANDDTAETEAVEHCEQFVDLICERLRQLPARG